MDIIIIHSFKEATFMEGALMDIIHSFKNAFKEKIKVMVSEVEYTKINVALALKSMQRIGAPWIEKR